MSIGVFLSTVSDEFRPYRDQLRGDLTRHNVEVKVQEDFKGLGFDTLDKLDVYIAHCDAVVHLVGEMTGSAPAEREVQALLRKYPDLADLFPPLAEALRNGEPISYTQWEAWLALYHDKLLLTAKADAAAPRADAFAPTDASRAAQTAHLARLQAMKRYPDCTFVNADQLAARIAYTGIMDLLVRHHAEALAAERDVAQGFIREMAARVSADLSLDLDGMKRAVANAIDIYVEEIVGAPERSNLGEAVDRAIARAKQQVAEGRNKIARATLDKAVADLKREETERRATYAEQVGTMLRLKRDIALAGYDASGAAEAVLELAAALHGEDRASRRAVLIAEGDSFYEHGQQRGSNVHLDAAIEVRRAALALAETPDEVAEDQNELGIALAARGIGDATPARLEQSIAAFRAAIGAYNRERAPLSWATAQCNCGAALQQLGERESGTARLEQAVEAFVAALEERARERVPLDWAMTNCNLGNALWTLGEREDGTTRLEQAVAAYCSALEEFPRKHRPLAWATTRNNFGTVLTTLGERENSAARLDLAVAAFGGVLEEFNRELQPLDWAMVQNNLGNALHGLGKRENDTARLEQAVAAYREALLEYTRERVPMNWATTQNNLGNALHTLGKLESKTVRFEQAVAAFRLAQEEWTRTRGPEKWATSQYNLANSLALLAQHRRDRAQMAEAIAAMRDAAEVYREGNNTYWLPIAEQRIAAMEAELANMP